MKPYYADETVTLYHGDWRALIPECFTADLIVADPPYGETSLAWDRWPDGWPALAARHSRSPIPGCPRLRRRVMRHLTECLPDCDGWPCRCPCHDDVTEYHSVTCMAGGFDGFDCDHSGHVSAGQPANGGNMETPPEGASTPLRRLTATASTDSPGGHHG